MGYLFLNIDFIGQIKFVQPLFFRMKRRIEIEGVLIYTKRLIFMKKAKIKPELKEDWWLFCDNYLVS